MSTENVEDFYDRVIAAIRDTLLQASKWTWSPPPPIDWEKLQKILPSSKGRWIPNFPRSPELQAARQLLPPYQPSYAGFRFVDVTRLGNFALIAFRWRETGDETFVHTVDLRPFVAEEPRSVMFAEAVITTNLLERLGGQWYQHQTLKHIKGLTFIE
jgi:hypothetical protein